MPKIPLYNSRSSIGVAKGVNVNPSLAIDLAGAESQNTKTRIFEDVLGMSKSFVDEYRDIKYKSDIKKSQQIEKEFKDEADTAWAKAQAEGIDLTTFKTKQMSSIRKKYEELYRIQGFSSEALRDSSESFNNIFNDELRNIDNKIAKKELDDVIYDLTENVYEAQRNDDLEGENASIEALAKVVGREQADSIASQGESLTVVESTIKNETLEIFSDVVTEYNNERTRAIDKNASIADQMKAYGEVNASFNDKIDQLIVEYPEYTKDLNKIRDDFMFQGQQDIVLGTITENAQVKEKQSKINNALTRLDELNKEADLENRAKNLTEVKALHEELQNLGHHANAEIKLDAINSYLQAGSYAESASILTNVQSYDEFKKEFEKVEANNKKGRYTVQQYQQLKTLERTAIRQDYHARFVQPRNDIISNPEEYTETKIRTLAKENKLTEEQTRILIGAYNSTQIENLYEAGADSPTKYMEINQLITEFRQQSLMGYFYQRLEKAKTDEEKNLIREEAASFNIFEISRPDLNIDSYNEKYETIMSKIYEQNDDDKYVLPKNLILDLTSTLDSVVGDSKSYSGELNISNSYQQKLYSAYTKIITPRIASMSTDAQLNAIIHMRSAIEQEIKRVVKDAPKKPFIQNVSAYGSYPVFITEESPQYSKETNERIRQYNEKSEEYKQSDHGLHEFLIAALMSHMDAPSIDVGLFNTRESTGYDAANKVYEDG